MNSLACIHAACFGARGAGDLEILGRIADRAGERGIHHDMLHWRLRGRLRVAVSGLLPGSCRIKSKDQANQKSLSIKQLWIANMGIARQILPGSGPIIDAFAVLHAP